jgi:hypothetical protein
MTDEDAARAAGAGRIETVEARERYAVAFNSN